MHEKLPHELIQEIYSFLSLKSKLYLTSCKKNVDNPLRKLCIRLSGINLLIPYLDVRRKNPLFFHEYDVIENKLFWKSLTPLERRNDSFKYLDTLGECLLYDFRIPIYSYSKCCKFMFRGMYSFRYKAYKYTMSSFSWGSPQDVSRIRNKTCYISAVYGVKSPSRMMRKILRSDTLKAIIG